MNIVQSENVMLELALWVGVAIIAAVALSYVLRPKTRALYPGGSRRYLAALTIQALGFMVPIPIVLVLLLGAPIPAGMDVIVAVCVGLAVVYILRSIPVTGPMLKDLHRARIEAAMQRLERRQ
jgi:hypothetical protein